MRRSAFIQLKAAAYAPYTESYNHWYLDVSLCACSLRVFLHTLKHVYIYVSLLAYICTCSQRVSPSRQARCFAASPYVYYIQARALLRETSVCALGYPSAPVDGHTCIFYPRKAWLQCESVRIPFTKTAQLCREKKCKVCTRVR